MSRRAVLEAVKAMTLRQSDSLLALMDIADRADGPIADELYDLIVTMNEAHSSLASLIRAHEEVAAESKRNSENREKSIDRKSVLAKLERYAMLNGKRGDDWKIRSANECGYSTWRRFAGRLVKLGITEDEVRAIMSQS